MMTHICVPESIRERIHTPKIMANGRRARVLLHYYYDYDYDYDDYDDDDDDDDDDYYYYYYYYCYYYYYYYDYYYYYYYYYYLLRILIVYYIHLGHNETGRKIACRLLTEKKNNNFLRTITHLISHIYYFSESSFVTSSIAKSLVSLT